MDTTTTLHAETPCCQRRVRLDRWHDVPRQVWERTCAGCHTDWEIEITFETGGNGFVVTAITWA